MDENIVGEISNGGNVTKKKGNEKEKESTGFWPDSRPRTEKQRRSIDTIIDCCTKLGLDGLQIDNTIKKLLDGNVIQSYTYNSNHCYKMKKVKIIKKKTIGG